ncbi:MULTISPECIES: BglG family transcription antiterminator [Virgibacillus]|uniref:BglG family transcription antiterminator n=1 Tax=Virgibacillus TaxID=84406 RepID=UPI0003884BD5|nr:BglG family transcription antiterminator [Virgibacillus sp. CM-4]EQB38038.1 hypothetical protein M948_05565 [Virgibacillus sp. CM-4]
MKLDDRSNTIFEALLNNPSMNSKEVAHTYKLTRRQLGYRIQKINQWLDNQGLPPIKRTRQGYFILDQNVYTALLHDQEGAKPNRILSESERVYMIVFMLISNNDLSLYHFSSELQVSKNTVLNDIKKAQQLVEPFQLTIRYSRKYGYLLEGNEFYTRKLLIHITTVILDMNDGEKLVRHLAHMQAGAVTETIKRIENIEKKLNLKFTDEKLASMPYILLLVLYRINKGHVIDSFYITYDELSNTKEYLATEEILFDHPHIPMVERLFITLHLLTINVYWSELLMEDTIPDLYEALDEMVTRFEKKSVVVIQDRVQLLQKLLLHVKPAYYRIKYELTEINHVQHGLSKEFSVLHHLVEQAIEPLAFLIGKDIPESETVYLTMLIGGWLTKQGDSIQKKIKAIVVCPNGVSVSRLMYRDLKDLFPEFVFLDSLSVREFKVYPYDYDLVFSPIPLETNKKLFTVSSVLHRDEKIRLKKQVSLELHGYFPSKIEMDEMLQIIKEHTTIHDKQQLAKRLYRYMHRDEAESIYTEEPPSSMMVLSDFLPLDHIRMVHTVTSWNEAVKLTAKPLLVNNKIARSYLEAMLNQKEQDPYIVIGNHLAIPHAAPEDGVRETSMSLLHIKEGVDYGKEYRIHIMVVIAAMDKQKHLKALLQLMRLAQSKDAMKTLMQIESKDKMKQLIQDYSFE